MDDDGDFGAFGRGFDDDFQPVNDSYENLINYIQSQGAHAVIAQMQAADDASGAGNGTYPNSHASSADANQPDGSWYNFPSADNTGANAPTFGSSASAPSNNADNSKLSGGLAKAFGDAGLGADSASAAASSIARKFGSGDTAVLNGLADTTSHVISTPLAAAEGVANTFKDVADGYTPAESVVGNFLRSGMVYGGGALAGALGGGLPGIAAGAGLDYMLPSGGAMGRSILNPPPSKYDFPTSIMLMAK